MMGRKIRVPKGFLKEYHNQKEMTQKEEKMIRSLRESRHQTPDVKAFLQSMSRRKESPLKMTSKTPVVGRGRGRPKKMPTVATDEPIPVKLRSVPKVNPPVEDNDDTPSVMEDNSVPIDSSDNMSDNSEPPNLPKQTIDMIERVDNQCGERPSSGEVYSHYLTTCEELTERLKSQGMESNLLTILKFYLLKSNLGDLDNSIQAIKLASEDMMAGTVYNIENNTSKSKRDVPQTAQTGHEWMGRVYTPQPTYDRSLIEEN